MKIIVLKNEHKYPKVNLSCTLWRVKTGLDLNYDLSASLAELSVLACLNGITLISILKIKTLEIRYKINCIKIYIFNSYTLEI